jgi:DNA processing protein
MAIDSAEARAYNALAITFQGSYQKLKKIKETHALWHEAWESLPPQERTTNPDIAWEKLEREGVSLILQEDKTFPALLKEIPWPPFALYIKGAIPQGDIHIAIVGTRKSTDAGKKAAHDFAYALAQKNITIVSGLAFGIDEAAHTGCLEAKGTTLAVLAHGLDQVYPASHANLAKKILESGGALISEYPLSSPTLPYRFLERNRIVSGLSQGILVIEAPLASGSLATARFALEQNREVFVIPGPATHPNFKGSHDLIRNGATLVYEPAHVLEALGVTTEEPRSNQTALFSPEEVLIIEIIKQSNLGTSVDKIIELSKLRTQVVSQALTLLVLKNAIKETGAGYSI